MQISVNVRKDGGVESTSIRLSSGFPALDASAQTYAATLRFVPARLASGEPTAGKITIPFQFKLNEPAYFRPDNSAFFKPAYFPEPDVLLIRGRYIYAEMGRDLGAALQRYTVAEPRKIVLDLRGNQGGTLLNTTVLASVFLPDGLKLASYQDKKSASQIDVRSGSASYQQMSKIPDPLSGLPAYFKTVPMWVLVNEKTAGLAELVAAALQHYQRAIIVGNKTAGDAMAQLGTLGRLEWLDADGESIAGRGVVPDVPWRDLKIGDDMPDIAVVEAVTAQAAGRWVRAPADASPVSPQRAGINAVIDAKAAAGED
ncbi:hypothetical protein JHS3_15060 [Jeongeupia sp. HS-3]|nr:TonB family protein [Jeongeupia sp. HS-3]BCL75770.1 hypothetical protein JHS3_15060 [Jeongeupia sp. HS-3]